MGSPKIDIVRFFSVIAAPGLAILSLLALSACAVGPDFASPPAPEVSGYTPEAKPAATVSADVAAGASQQFAIARDIPGEWWKVFHSRELDALTTQALLANPNLEAAQASLWQAKENLYAQAGSLLPTVDANASATRQQFSPSEFGGSRPAVDLQSLPGERERLLCSRRFRRHTAADRIVRRNRRLSTFRA